MLREDKKAGFFYDRPLLFWRSYFFRCTSIKLVRFRRADMESLRREQMAKPVRVLEHGHSRRVWWWFENSFYWEDDGYSSDDVLALVRDRQRRKQRQLQRAKDLLSIEEDRGPRRDPIPRDIRRAVFTRDGGRCVQCSGTFDLQYDHILPVALGGATTIQNLQVLCADCNREKSDSV
jgi:5-methylcytosine-specific restriction endonuclease McrA